MFFLGSFLYRLRMRYQQFMVGRYGVDELNIFLVVSSCVFTLLARVFFNPFFFVFSWILLIFCMYRMFSRNIAKRYNEKEKFLKLKSKFTSWYRIKRDAWRNRKTHKYFRCKNCHASIRVPRGVGKIRVSCPKCRKEMIKKA